MDTTTTPMRRNNLFALWTGGMLLVAAFLSLFSSCSLIYDDDCACGTADTSVVVAEEAHYYVALRYDMNMEWADAFEHYVRTVSLSAFDDSGVCVYTKEALADTLEGQRLDISDITPGTYTLIVWALGDELTADSYTLPVATVGVTTLSEMDAMVNRDADQTVDHDLTLLFHAIAADCDIETLDADGTRTIEMDLTRNTNTVRIVLQNLSGDDLSADDFTMTITDNNGRLDYDNSRPDDDTYLSYRPWSLYAGTAGVETSAIRGDDAATTRATTQVSAVVGELTVNRLFADSPARLTVSNNNTGETIVSIPLIDYALLIKGNYNSTMDDQEYLDRQSEYNYTFFLDDSGNWYGAYIYINSWRVVLIDTEL